MLTVIDLLASLMIIRKLFICLFLAVYFGCSDGQQSIKSIPNLTTFRVEGVPEIRLTKDESFRGSQHAEVNKIGDIAADSLGNVYFVDEYKHKIQVVDRDGTPTGTMGRAGGRAGEFRKLGDIEVRNGKVYGYDEDRKAMNVYTTNEYDFSVFTAFSSSELKVDSLQMASPFVAKILAEGDYLVGFQVVKSPENRHLYFYKVNPEGEIISDQLINFPNKPLFVENDPKGMIIMMMPYERETLIFTDSEGAIYTLFTEDFLIRKFDAEGNYLEAWRYPIKKRTLNTADAVDMFDDVDIRRAIRGDDLPGTWPAVATVLVDDEDRFWVATITQDLDNYRWYVLGKRGSVLGTVELPRKVDIKAVQNGKVYARAFNKRTFAEEVVRYEIR